MREGLDIHIIVEMMWKIEASTIKNDFITINNEFLKFEHDTTI